MRSHIRRAVWSAARGSIGLVLALTAMAGPARATLLFSDSLQGTLSQWNNPASAGKIVNAPDGAKALTFALLQVGSNMLQTTSAFTSSSGQFTISFEIYANCGHTSGCGAFLWSNGAKSSSSGFILSDTSFGTDALFPDSSGWETVSYTFAGTPTNLAFEDWASSPYAQAYPGANAIYIRDLTLTNDPNGLANGTLTVTAVSAPEPATLGIFATALLGLTAVRGKARVLFSAATRRRTRT